jgi:hypothetical protein
VIHAWTIRFGVGVRRRFEEREFRWDRTNFFFDLAEERGFWRLPGRRMPTDQIPDVGIETLRRGSSSEKNPPIANE